MLQASQVAPEQLRPLKRSEYDRLVRLGAFEDDRVELIRGTLLTMAPNHPQHASPIDIFTRLLVRALGDRAVVRVQQPIIACDESEPQPDVAVVPAGSYREEHPSRAHLVIEVALSSLAKDRGVKGPLYAQSGFGEYWIANVAERVIEVHRAPGSDGYAEVTVHAVGETLHPLAFPDVELPVGAVFE